MYQPFLIIDFFLDLEILLDLETGVAAGPSAPPSVTQLSTSEVLNFQSFPTRWAGIFDFASHR